MEVLRRLCPSQEVGPTALCASKVYEKKGCAVELLFRLPPTDAVQEQEWTAQNAKYTSIDAQQDRGRDVRVFVMDGPKTVSGLPLT